MNQICNLSQNQLLFVQNSNNSSNTITLFLKYFILNPPSIYFLTSIEISPSNKLEELFDIVSSII